MSVALQFGLLSVRPSSFAEGIATLREVRQELERDPAHAFSWGATSVVANAALIAMNVVVQEFILTQPVQSLHHQFVRDVYARFAAVGLRADAAWIESLEALAMGLRQNLLARGLTAGVPTVMAISAGVSATLSLCQDMAGDEPGGPSHLAKVRAIARALEEIQRQVRVLANERSRALGQMRRLAWVA